ncbi:MAG: yigZ [Acidobacteria bacterium]|nr:yigZ [Acidobacteriota bacterium]
MTARVPAGEATSELRELGSRFFAFLAPAPDAAAAQAFLDSLRRRFPDATHHCFAWRVGDPPVERAGDDGEPAGTAGPPMLAALRAAGLTGVVAVVVRWFGGTKLGKGGLVRAYGGAVRAALERLPVRVERARVRLALAVPPDQAGALRRLLRPGEVELVAERWGAVVELELAVAVERREEVLEALARLGLAPRPA